MKPNNAINPDPKKLRYASHFWVRLWPALGFQKNRVANERKQKNKTITLSISSLDGISPKLYDDIAMGDHPHWIFPLSGDAMSEDNTTYKVVVNVEEQYAIWPADRDNPLGWNDAGKSGTNEECTAYINEVWTDMRPLSLRKLMGSQ